MSEGQAFHSMPTWRQRLNRRLGFTLPFSEEDFEWRNAEQEGFAPGAMMTRVVLRVSLLDRIRLLITGRCMVEVTSKTDKIIERAESRSSFCVRGFGDY